MKKIKKAHGRVPAESSQGIPGRVSAFLFSMPFSLAAGIVFAAAIGAATFIEARHGTDAARSIVYNATWFEIFLVLVGLNLTANIFKHRMWRNGKEMVFLFHSAFLLILVGAGITRHFGFEGTMRIREGSRTNSVLSNDVILAVSLRSGGQRSLFEHPLPASKAASGRFDHTWDLNGRPVRLRLAEVIRGAEKRLVAADSGRPGCTLLILDGQETRSFTLIEPDSVEWNGVKFVFSAADAPAPSGPVVRIRPQGGKPSLCSGLAVDSYEMTGPLRRTHRPGVIIPVVSRTVYAVGTIRFVPGPVLSGARVEAVRPEKPVGTEEAAEGRADALVFEATVDGSSRKVPVFGAAGAAGREENLKLNGVEISLTYGSRDVRLPFFLTLNDFRVDRYPGSMKPSGFTSEVTLTDREEALEKPVSIFMNHILRYRGYRFYQSSYDEDERGTVLSVSRDPGMLPTYAGYLLLAMGLVFNIFSSRSRFRLIGQVLKKSTGAIPAVMLAAWLLSAAANAGTFDGPEKIFDLEAGTSRRFGMLAVQDNQGRIKPVQSLALEVIRGESRLRGLKGLDADRLALWMSAFPEQAGPSGYFENSSPEKLLRLFPMQNDSSGRWAAADEAPQRMAGEDLAFVQEWNLRFRSSVRNAAWLEADSLIAVLETFQVSRSAGLHPGRFLLKAEVVYNRADAFGRLGPVLFWIGLALLAGSAFRILRPDRRLKSFCVLLAILILIGFAVQTASLGLRWFVSGHAPWTNKYESMVFIAWSALLAGVTFGFRNRLTLAGSSMLSGILLSVAAMGWMDPRITTLPPVLKSIWLVIHVSVITSSYGFLALAAVLALVNLLLMVFKTRRSSRFLEPVVEYQTHSIERILTVGLTLLTIGNFLGAVWANESWGRYWGWDPKETWTLVTMLVYAVVLHLRLVRGLGRKVIFNIASLFAVGSVMMTYFGVNLYLSGMHSYAAGERPGFPTGVFAAFGVLAVLSAVAWQREKTGHHH